MNDSIIMYPLYALNKDNNEWTWIPDADDENIDVDDAMLIMKSLKTDANISVQDTRVNGFTENWFETNSHSMTHNDDNVFIISRGVLSECSTYKVFTVSHWVYYHVC